MAKTTDVLVGVDIGTTNCKAVVLRPSGELVGHGFAPTPWTPVDGGAEAPAERLLDAVLAGVRSALAPVGPARVLAIGLAGLAESGVLLDTAGRPVAPVIAWYDARGETYVERLRRDAGPAEFAAVTGLSLTSRPSVFTYCWLTAEDGASTRPGVRWLSVPEWVAYALGGEPVAEASLAGRTGFFDVHDTRPAESLLTWAGAPADLLGPIVSAGQPTGAVRAEFAELAGAAITIAGHDHLAAAVGAGATGIGDLLDSCGTSEALVRSLGGVLGRRDIVRAVERGISVGRHVLAGRMQLMVGLQSGIGMYRFLKLMGYAPGDPTNVDRLDAAALAVEPGPDSPAVEDIWAPRATLRNIGYDTTPAQVWRAVVEAVQKRAVVLKGLLDRVAGPTERIVATGGGLRSVAVRELKRRILGDYIVPEVEEAGARGAAVLAAVAGGIVADPADLAPKGPDDTERSAGKRGQSSSM